jgi:hypothetical protein
VHQQADVPMSSTVGDAEPAETMVQGNEVVVANAAETVSLAEGSVCASQKRMVIQSECVAEITTVTNDINAVVVTENALPSKHNSEQHQGSAADTSNITTTRLWKSLSKQAILSKISQQRR